MIMGRTAAIDWRGRHAATSNEPTISTLTSAATSTACHRWSSGWGMSRRAVVTGASTWATPPVPASNSATISSAEQRNTSTPTSRRRGRADPSTGEVMDVEVVAMCLSSRASSGWTPGIGATMTRA
jgi:hypothetical protein